MKTKKMLTNLIYLLIMSSFLFDSYFKLSNLSVESDLLRSKYHDLSDLIKRHTGFVIPYDTGDIAYGSLIGAFATIQGLLAMFVILGQRQLAIVLILMTLVQTFVMHNPYYRNSTEIDRQKCLKHIFTDMCLIATLFIVTGMTKFTDQHTRK